MFDKKEEEQYLAITNRRIAETEEKIDLLTRQIEALEDVRSLNESLELLATAREVLDALKTLRCQVLNRLQSNDGH